MNKLRVLEWFLVSSHMPLEWQRWMRVGFGAALASGVALVLLHFVANRKPQRSRRRRNQNLTREFLAALEQLEARGGGSVTVHGLRVVYHPPRETSFGLSKPRVYVDAYDFTHTNRLDFYTVMGFGHTDYFRSIQSAAKYAAKVVATARKKGLV